jgi:hypothetical protein
MMLRLKSFISLAIFLAILNPMVSFAAAPLSVSLSPGNTVALNTTINVQASGGSAPYWITVSNPAMVLYTPGKLDKNGRPSGLWNMTVIKPGQCTFTMRDATGATATATLTATMQAAPPPTVAPLAASLTNPSPYINEVTTLKVTGGAAPYKVSSPSPGVSITAITQTQWNILASLPGSFTLNIADLNSVHTAAVSGTAKDRITDLAAFFRDGKSTIYSQWPDRTTQQISLNETLTLQITGGKGPWSVETNPAWLKSSGPLGNSTAPYYQLAWTGTSFTTTDVVVRDSRGQVKVFKVTSPPPLLLDFWPKNRTIKVGEAFLIIVRGGAGSFHIDWDQKTALAPLLKNMQHSDPGVLQTWSVTGLQPGNYRFQVSDETAKITRFFATIGLTVTP